MSSFSPPALLWVGVCGASCGGFLLCLFLRRLRFSASFPTAGYPSGVTHPLWLHLPVLLLRWGCVCGVCGVFSAAHIFSLVPCSSYGACGFVQLPLPQVTLWGFCCCSGGEGWTAAFSFMLSVLLLRRLACRYSVFCTLCRDSAIEVVTSIVCQFGGVLQLPAPFGLCLLVCQVSLASGWVCFWPAVSGCPHWLRYLCSLCSLSLLGLLLCLFVLLRLWRGRLFGRSLLLPPAAHGGCAPLVFLLWLSVPLPSCRTLSSCCFSPGFHPLAFVQAWVGRLRSCLGSSLLLGGSPSLVLIVFAWLFQLFLSRLLEFLELFAGVSLLSLPVFADGLGCLADSPWLSALCCLAPGGVTLFFCQGPVVLA